MAISFGLALKSNEETLKNYSIKHIKTDGLETKTNGIPPKRLIHSLATSERINSTLQLELQAFSLTNVLAHLTVPQGQTPIHWLDMQKTTTNKAETALEEYKRALRLFFSILVTSPSVKLYDVAMQQFVAVHLQGNMLEFLARMWSENDTISPPVVKGRALQLANLYLSAHTRGSVDYQIILPSLLIVIGHESHAVRKQAVECLGKLHKQYDNMGAVTDAKFYGNNADAVGAKKKAAASMYGSSMAGVTKLSHADAGHFVDHLWFKKRELAEDPNYLSVVLKEYLDACAAANKKTKLNRILDFFLNCIDHYPTIYGQVALLKKFSLVQSPRKISSLLGLLERSLTATITKESTELIAELIRCFTPEFAPEMGHGKADKSLKLFCSLLNNKYNMEVKSDDDAWEISTRRMALQQITSEFFAATTAKAKEEMFKVMVDIATDSEQRDIKAVKSVIRDIDLTADLIEPFLQGTAKKITDFSEHLDTPTKKQRKEV